MLDGQNHSNDELEVEETSYEDDTKIEETAEENELETEPDDTSGDDTVTLSKSELDERIRDARKDQDKRWKERIKGLEGKEGREDVSQESSKESQTNSKEVVSEDNNRLRLEMKGIEDKSQQDIVLKYARLEGIGVYEALNDPVVQMQLEKLKGTQERTRATQSPINRTGKPREKTAAEMAKEWTAGKQPQTKEARRAALKALQEQMKD